MTFEEFASARAEPQTLPPALRALWHDRSGDWEEAHRLIMDAADEAAAWVHAYLHRKEGDLANARYWYRRAKRAEASGSLESEWTAIVRALLSAPE